MSLLRLMKGVYTALFLFIINACSPSCPSWNYECSIACDARQSSGRIYLCGCDHFKGLEVELVRTLADLRMYINVFGLEITPDCHDPSTAKVYVSFKDHSYTFSAIRFTGGQRLLIPESTRDEIIAYLNNCQPVYLRVGRYEGDIYPQQFIEVYDRLMNTRF